MICYFNNGNNIRYNPTHVFVITLITNNKHGLWINHVNLRQSLSLYTARSLIANTWENNPDMYLKPYVHLAPKKDKKNDF
jgi:hypothetical protein